MKTCEVQEFFVKKAKQIMTAFIYLFVWLDAGLHVNAFIYLFVHILARSFVIRKVDPKILIFTVLSQEYRHIIYRFKAMRLILSVMQSE